MWWLPVPAEPTVLRVDDQRRAWKRVFASVLVSYRAASETVGTQADAAKAVGTSEATYRRWESLDDMNMPDAWQIKRLCVVYECEPNDLLKPEPFSDRERALVERAARASARGVRRVTSGE